MNLEGKRALVTGAGKRIGRSVALALAERGVRVAIHCHRSRAEADEVSRDAPGSVVLEADLADRAARAALVPQAIERLGGLDILVNNASIHEAIPADEIDEQAWARALEVDLTAPFFLARDAAMAMRGAGGGAIVNLTDWGVARPYPTYLPYFAAKAALESMTAGLARAYAPEVRVNAIAPGAIVFDPNTSEALEEAILDKTPLRRVGGVESVSSSVVYLLCNDFVTGETIRVDGGRSLR